MQYTAIFHGLINDNFQMKHRLCSEADLTSTHNPCFRAKIRKLGIPLVNPNFTI